MEHVETLSCPNCKTNIPLDDVNVSTDIALCRNCGRNHSYSLLASRSDLPVASPKNPPRWIRLEQDYAGRKLIRYKRIPGIVFFLIPFTAFWSGFSMWGIYIDPILKGEIDTGDMLFGIPFLLGTIALVFSIIICLFVKWVITLDRGEGTVFVGVGRIGWKRQFHYDRNSFISLTKTEFKVNEEPQDGILIHNDERDFVFGTLLKEQAKQYIASLISQEAADS